MIRVNTELVGCLIYLQTNTAIAPLLELVRKIQTHAVSLGQEDTIMYTKGKWNVKQSYSDSHIIFSVSTDDEYICRLWLHGTGKPSGQGRLKTNEDLKRTEANARLIAAAPELLEACRYIIQRINDTDMPWWITSEYKGGFDVKKIEQAIAKAERTEKK